MAYASGGLIPAGQPTARSVAYVPHLRPRHRRDERMGMAAPLYYTAEQVRAFPADGKRYEVVHGELLVTPAPRLFHQELVRRLLIALSAYLEAEPVGHVLPAPADIAWGPDTLVQPDIFVVPIDQARTLEWSRVTDLLLVAEVVSPSSARADRFTKRVEYQRRNVPLYWVLDGDRQEVEVWTPGAAAPESAQEELVWQPAGAGAPFRLRTAKLFRPI